MIDKKFKLSDKFIEKYQKVKPPFGFNGLGELVYMRTYSRIKDDGSNEQWWETIRRVVEGTYRMQQKHIDAYNLGWDSAHAQRSAQEMYDRMFNMKFLPPGRGLWAMGTSVVEDKGLTAALLNCAFISTEDMQDNPTEPFTWLMDCSMVGVGVGYDTKGAGSFTIKGINSKRPLTKYVVSDDREGWVESTGMLLDHIFSGRGPIEFDYSKIRPAGQLIKGFGGVAAGPDPLRELHERIMENIQKCAGEPISSRNIVDIQNMIGACVVAGNIRRSAEIVFGDPSDEEYIDLKNYKVNPDREAYGWTSNNSIFAELGMDYSKVAERTRINGEPGYIWLDNIRKYSRMNNGPDNKDHRACGTNPCVEQSLESKECCVLVESFPDKHEDIDDYKRTLKFAYLYAKTVTLGKTHWPDTNRVMLRNRRIGCSMSGIAQFIAHRGLHELKKWCEEGYKAIQEYDQVYSDWLAVPKSIKTTSVKPSGSVSLVAGATPGIHHPESRFYIRRVRLAIKSPLVTPLKKAGYKIEPCVGQEDSTLVVELPVDCGEGVRKVTELSIWEQFNLAAFMQKHWADNQVSCSVSFDPDKEGDQVVHCLNHFQYQLKGISLLPKHEEGAYKQMPYEEIDEETYKKMISGLKKVNFSHVSGNEANIERFCDGVSCEIELPPAKGAETLTVEVKAEVKPEVKATEEPKK